MFYISHEPTLEQKLQKSMSCHHTGEMKIVANLKDKTTESQSKTGRKHNVFTQTCYYEI